MEAVESLEIKTQTIEKSIFWKKEDNFSVDENIEAFLSGLETNGSDEKKTLNTKIENDFRLNTKVAEEILSYLKSLNIIVRDVHLKYNGPGNYDMLVIVDENSFEDDELISKTYKKSAELRKKYNDKFYNIRISFIQKTAHFDRTNVLCDGYGMTYVGEI